MMCHVNMKGGKQSFAATARAFYQRGKAAIRRQYDHYTNTAPCIKVECERAVFLHAFATLQPNTEIQYKCSDYYAPEADVSIEERMTQMRAAGVDLI